MKKHFILWIISVALFASCNQDNELPAGLQPLGYNPPAFGEPIYNYANNPLTKEGFELGRALFYDPILSKDSTLSCGSCHQQAAAFAHFGQPISRGVEGRLGTRHSPTIFNNRWYREFFWDGGGNHIEIVPLNAIINPLEMNEDLAVAVEKLNRSATYSAQFRAAFGIEIINSKYLFYALAQFTGAMTSDNSKYDKVQKGKIMFTANEAKGYALFKKSCSSCHTEPLFTNNDYLDNGLTMNASGDDGRRNITLREADLGKFRVPSLRNVAVSPPYMHDGRLATLEEVMTHYRTGIAEKPNLAPQLRGGIALTDEETTQIIEFLHTLTDHSFLNDERFTNPL